jgi:hypothetical protein
MLEQTKMEANSAKGCEQSSREEISSVCGDKEFVGDLGRSWEDESTSCLLKGKWDLGTE